MKKKLLNALILLNWESIESDDWFELDNLDKAKLVMSKEGQLEVENEHGTRFPFEDLSKEEVKTAKYILGLAQ